MDFNRIVNGMIRAMRLDKSFYEEVEHDPSYNQDALGVVILVSVVGAVGSFLGDADRRAAASLPRSSA